MSSDLRRTKRNDLHEEITESAPGDLMADLASRYTSA